MQNLLRALSCPFLFVRLPLIPFSIRLLRARVLMSSKAMQEMFYRFACKGESSCVVAAAFSHIFLPFSNVSTDVVNS